MAEAPQKFSRTMWIGIGLLIVILCVSYVLSHLSQQRSQITSLPVLGQVADFSLTNQAGDHVSLADLRGHVWVADVIFTRCAGPCPRMTQQMKQLQDALPPTSHAKLVTLTTDPDYDTPQILTRYGERFGADTNHWMFLTGTKKEIGALAVNSLKLSAVPVKAAEQANPVDLFVHSTIFVVVGKKARLRGVFETTGPGIDPARVQSKILATVRQLEREQ
jgi:cytochrome oxidase Cu insertion factor (SCO1/SenC/PrrC family)